jgi:hypothetical protein
MPMDDLALRCGAGEDREPESYPVTRPKPGEGLTCNPMDDPSTWAGGGKINGQPIRRNDRR